MEPSGGHKSRILIIGGTGHLGKFIVAASARAGHPTTALVRAAAPPASGRARLLQSFSDAGVTILQGDIGDHDLLVKAVKAADVVISVVGYDHVGEQSKIIDAIKEAGGNVKRFIPSDFGNDADHAHIVEPAKATFDVEAQIRRTVEAEGIPYTFVSCNFFAGYYLPTLVQPGASGLPTDKVVILGDGNTKAIFVNEEDIATFTIKAVDDPRTLNKVLHIRPPENALSMNDLVSLWENKVGKTFERVYLTEEEVFKQIRECPPLGIDLAILHSAYINGDHINFEIEPLVGVEATEIYPDIKYSTVDEYLNRLL
uniref:NmrA-like domain-containing protein n=1 Tax=Leersia perrieri TaxID=77586 RepID=A0A0D9WQ57_9ORYZ